MSQNKPRSPYVRNVVSENREHTIAGCNTPGKEELELLVKKFAPLLSFHPADPYKPVSVEFYLQRTSLVCDSAKSNTQLTTENLPLGQNTTERYYLEPDEISPAAFHLGAANARVYVNAKAFNSDYTDLQYWFFFPAKCSNVAGVKWLIDDITGHNTKINLEPFGKINGHWQHLTIRLNNSDKAIEQVFFPMAGGGKWITSDKLQTQGNQVQVYVTKSGHHFYPSNLDSQSNMIKFDLFSSRLEFSLASETTKSDFISTADSCTLVSASYLGDDKPAEPAWLNYFNYWSNPMPEYVDGILLKRMLHTSFGKNLDFLLRRDILNDLSDYLVDYYNREIKPGTLGPKTSKCWLESEM